MGKVAQCLAHCLTLGVQGLCLAIWSPTLFSKHGTRRRHTEALGKAPDLALASVLKSGLRAPVSTPPDLCDNPKRTRSVQSSGSHVQKNALLCQHQSPPEEGGYDKVQKSYHRMKGKGVPLG